MHLVLFEDPWIERLHPITVGRVAHAMQCGGFRLADWIEYLPERRWAVVRPYLREVHRAEFPRYEVDPPPREDGLLLVNARLVPSLANFRALERLLAGASRGVVRDGESVLAARLEPEDARPESIEQDDWCAFLESAPIAGLPPLDESLDLFRYPHDLIDANHRILRENLEFRLSLGRYREVSDGLFLADGARLGEHVVANTRAGPILLDENASVGPHSYLAGPAYVGRNSRLIEHAAIKDAVSIGHTVKIGGEVEASIIEPYTNKQHYGFLGHSYLGSWINLGAGTCNSDLKNTYGPINMDYAFGRVATGRQFVGCIMGDYAKSAINTGIFTGKTIGACSMLYGFVTTNVPSFVNYARLFGQVTELPPEVMIATQQRMFARRNVVQRPCDVQLIRDMHDVTRGERQATGDPLSL
ncbi:MAG: glucose-1-phosphate thymidylyltransferase [Planctomycetes bacterium]|nr:glucose-1-phosphate thymidylyltransferase [Planctomycetota bacterium]